MAEPIELKEKALQLFLDNPLFNVTDVANELDIPLDTIREWSNLGGWYKKRRDRQFGGAPPEIEAQAREMRAAIYDKVVNSEYVSADDAVKLVESWLKLSTFEPKEDTFDRESLMDYDEAD